MTPEQRPRLAAKARLRRDQRGPGHLLLYPEHGLALSDTAAAVLRLCTGERSVDDIVGVLGDRHPDAPRATIARDVGAFLDALVARGLIVAVP
jgi:coenzyme PQQ biosynthesis protein PqqD